MHSVHLFCAFNYIASFWKAEVVLLYSPSVPSSMLFGEQLFYKWQQLLFLICNRYKRNIMVGAQVTFQFFLATPLLRTFQLSFLQCFLFFSVSTIVFLCSISEPCAGEVIFSTKGVCLHERSYEKTWFTV